MAQKLSVEAITWEFSEPRQFPCFVCGVRKAVVRTTLLVGFGNKIIISHCGGCGLLSAEEMVDRLEIGREVRNDGKGTYIKTEKGATES